MQSPRPPEHQNSACVNRRARLFGIDLARSIGAASLLDAAVRFARAGGSGDVEWSRQIGTTDNDDGFGLAVDAASNSFISGVTGVDLGGPTEGGEDAFLPKFDESARRIESPLCDWTPSRHRRIQLLGGLSSGGRAPWRCRCLKGGGVALERGAPIEFVRMRSKGIDDAQGASFLAST